MDDFRPGKPGSEEVREQMEPYGLFLLDGNRGYDEQALNALQACLKKKEGQFRDFVDRLRDSRITAGSPITPEAMEEAKRRGGYDKFEKDIEVIRERVGIIKSVLAEEGIIGRVKEPLDPKRTCFASQPPRPFPSEVALRLFLSNQKPDFVKQHEELQAAMMEA